MLTALILLVPTVENGRILSSGWTPYAYFLSIAAYIAYLFSKWPEVRERYRSNAKIRYATWAALILAIIVAFL